MPYGWGKWDCPPKSAGDGCDCSGLASREFGLGSKQGTNYFFTWSTPVAHNAANHLLTIFGESGAHMMVVDYYAGWGWYVWSCGSPCSHTSVSEDYFYEWGYESLMYG